MYCNYIVVYVEILISIDIPLSNKQPKKKIKVINFLNLSKV